VGGRPLILLTAGSDRYAYDRSCPACTASLADGTLDGDDLVCARCGRTYDVRHAGRERDGGSLHLEPVPLLVGADGSLRIAIGAATP
jgi:nitrite reductase/ring-hydroxylating ferredoxin subunit